MAPATQGREDDGELTHSLLDYFVFVASDPFKMDKYVKQLYSSAIAGGILEHGDTSQTGDMEDFIDCHHAVTRYWGQGVKSSSTDRPVSSGPSSEPR